MTIRLPIEAPKTPPPPSRPLVVCQVLTETKRAEIRARNDEISRREKEAKKQMVVMEDQEEMLAAAEAIPVPVSKTPLPPHLQQETLENGGKGRRLPGTAGDSGGGDGDREGRRRRDPLTAWVCNCYNNDEYAGHVSDLRQFLRGIDFHHVSCFPWDKNASSTGVKIFSIVHPCAPEFVVVYLLCRRQRLVGRKF